jgi:DNA mismatch endonuclease, patch repair protein
MADKLSPERRSANMRRIKSKNMKPEKQVRSLAHRLGFRFRLHRKELPGKPDLVFPSRRKVIFVHGCFWHQHKGCRHGRIPSSNLSYWMPKLARNVERDAQHLASLEENGWHTLVIWECEAADAKAVTARLAAFLS